VLLFDRPAEDEQSSRGLSVKFNAKATLPIAVLMLAAAITAILFSAYEPPDTVPPVTPHPLVETQLVQDQLASLVVKAQGTVEPRTESDLIAEVSGRVVWISPNLASGGFFKTGEAVARIEPRLFEATLEGARAALSRAQSELKLAHANYERERSMGRGGASSQAKLDRVRHAEAAAKAGVREAEVAIDRAEYDLEQCEIRAPFDGRVREKFVGVGQFLNRGNRVARVYAIDYAEIRLPISDRDLAFLDLSLGYREEPDVAEAQTKLVSEFPSVEEDLEQRQVENADSTGAEGDDADRVALKGPLETADGPEVLLTADFLGRINSWTGRVVRVEGALDLKTRMVNVVVRVDDPYGRGDDPSSPPLVVGLYVNAEIRGRAMTGVYALPRTALRANESVVIVKNDRIELREVEVVRAEADQIWVSSGVEVGDQVATTAMDVVVEGMLVRARPALPMRSVAAESVAP
jgi:RND family efflux transporter MFP subunit